MLLGNSDAIQDIHTIIHQLRNNDTTSVLITGETGVGKEVVARAIHTGGPRASEPFVAVNCGAITSTLWESVFFGHVRGAFTGATENHKGHFESADGGTLFLDEIGDMPIEHQVKLLRVLDDGVVMRVGATQSKKVDIRVIAATNAGLSAKTDAKLFRSDLYHRLTGMIIWIPPLCERKEDIFPIAEYYLNAFAAQMGVTPSLTPEAVEALETYDFPGNVRELMNIIENALIVSEDAAIQPKHLRFRSPDADVPTPPVTEIDEANPLPPVVETMLAEQVQIRRALAANRGNIAKTARHLGLSRQALYRRMEKYGIR